MKFTDQEWFPESLYNNWLADSLVLMTASLLFYHMTQKNSLEMDYRIAGIFAVALILCSMIMGITSLYPYYQRMGLIIDKDDSEEHKQENTYRLINTVLGSIIITIQLGITITIIKGVINKMK